jgi:hypothetical protein
VNVASLVMVSPRLILDGLLFAAVLIFLLFAITSLAVGVFYVIRIAASYLRGGSLAVPRERESVAREASNLAIFAIASGPLVALLIGLISCGAGVILEGRNGLLTGLGLLLLMMGLGAVAGLIAGGAFLLSSRIFGRFRKVVMKLRSGGVWDPELDGLA